MIVNIRGTNGSGKSTIVRNLLMKGTPQHIYGLLGPKKPEAYRLDLGGPPIFVLGPYESPKTGVGCDAITDYLSILDLIRKYEPRGHVVFEGAMISAVWGALGALLDSITPPPIVAFLDTPLSQCVLDIRARTLVSNKLHTVESKYKYLVKLRQRLLAEGRLGVLDLSRERGAECILEELQINCLGA